LGEGLKCLCAVLAPKDLLLGLYHGKVSCKTLWYLPLVEGLAWWEQVAQQADLDRGELARQAPSKVVGSRWVRVQSVHVQVSELWWPQLVAAQEFAPVEVAVSRVVADVAVQNLAQAQQYSMHLSQGLRVAGIVAMAVQIHPEWR
jgi:hypothetical protein